MTLPLITMSDGRKFGKSEKGNIWLDRRRTHPYFVWKYFFDVPDADAVRLLNFLTLLPLEEIADLTARTATEPQLRAAQRRLATAVTALVHGSEVAVACENLEAAMHAEDVARFETAAATLGLLDPASLAGDAEQAKTLPVAHRPRSALAGEGLSIADLAVEIGLFGSKGDVRREVSSGHSGFTVAGVTVSDIGMRLTSDIVGSARVVLLRKGKKNKRMLCFHEG
jgi:tyrosyl-tRNA synthetase